MRVALLLFLMEWNKIQNGEGGLSVRSKINNAIQGLIGGNKGLLRVWESLAELLGMVEANKEDSDTRYTDLRKGVQRSYAYTDKQVSQATQVFTKRLTEIQNADLRNKGFFSTLEVLVQNWPTSEVGTIAYIGTSVPYKVYKWSDDGGWYDTGETYSGEGVNVDAYLKKGLTIGDSTQLVDIQGNEIHPITSTEAVKTAEGRNLEDALAEMVAENVRLHEENVALIQALAEKAVLSDEVRRIDTTYAPDQLEQMQKDGDFEPGVLYIGLEE